MLGTVVCQNQGLWGKGPRQALDASGELYDGRKFSDAKELKKLLLDDTDKFATAFTEKLATYALRRRMSLGIENGSCTARAIRPKSICHRKMVSGSRLA